MTKRNKKRNIFYQAQAILARRDHAEAEIRQKLARKGFSFSEIQGAINWLFEQNLINDAKFAQMYTASILRSKPVGPQWLKAKLRQRGVESEDIEAAIDIAYQEKHELSFAQQAAASWKKVHPNKADDKAKLMRFLASRGFSTTVIDTVVNKTYANY